MQINSANSMNNTSLNYRGTLILPKRIRDYKAEFDENFPHIKFNTNDICDIVPTDGYGSDYASGAMTKVRTKDKKTYTLTCDYSHFLTAFAAAYNNPNIKIRIPIWHDMTD